MGRKACFSLALMGSLVSNYWTVTTIRSPLSVCLQNPAGRLCQGSNLIPLTHWWVKILGACAVSYLPHYRACVWDIQSNATLPWHHPASSGEAAPRSGFCPLSNARAHLSLYCLFGCSGLPIMYLTAVKYLTNMAVNCEHGHILLLYMTRFRMNLDPQSSHCNCISSTAPQLLLFDRVLWNETKHEPVSPII